MMPKQQRDYPQPNERQTPILPQAHAAEKLILDDMVEFAVGVICKRCHGTGSIGDLEPRLGCPTCEAHGTLPHDLPYGVLKQHLKAWLLEWLPGWIDANYTANTPGDDGSADATEPMPRYRQTRRSR